MKVPEKIRKFRERWVAFTPDERARFIASASPKRQKELRWTAYYWLREDQVISDGFNGRFIFARCGRGYGKTFLGAAYIQLWVEHILPGSNGDICIVVPTHADVHKTIMKAFREIYPSDECPDYIENKGEIRFKNGTVVHTQSSDQPLRGGNWQFVWCDEVKAWCDEIDEKISDKFETFQLGVRNGAAQILLTTTPSPARLFKKLQKRALAQDPGVLMMTGSMLDNPELSPDAVRELMLELDGTRKGRTEIYGEIVDDNPYALWSMRDFEDCRVEESPPILRTVVSIDPSVTAKKTSDLCGLTVAALGQDKHGYVLEDASMRASPDAWAKKAVELFYKYQADCIVAEVNNGGDMIAALIKTIDPRVLVKTVHASKGKLTRAEPIANLYKKTKDGNPDPMVHHVGAAKHFRELEDECLSYTADSRSASPDRMDSLVWALTELFWNSRTASQVDLQWAPVF